MNEQAYLYGTGRRKTAVARVRLMPGTGNIIINGKPVEELFQRPSLQRVIRQPLEVTDNLGKFNASIKVVGGGVSGQAGAICHGISRALIKGDETLKPLLRQHGLLTRDPRMKERKKYGLKRARKAEQYRKR